MIYLAFIILFLLPLLFAFILLRAGRAFVEWLVAEVGG